ncbi:MAG: hypothetical protein ACHQ16_03160, partial [Candidatus Lutacidiplasmatales archaeon]
AANAPPGAPYPVGWSPAKPADNSSDNGSLGSPVFSSGHCAGLYPDSGQNTYYDNCVGHDEPGIQFYSNLPGSAGNMTWNVTLPVDTGTGQNQSNLYVAIWFGMTLSDPLAWMDQCFLELQFYPDSTWGTAGDVEGKWVAAAVAWQIEAATGYEDPCYYSELYNNGIPGPTVFNMTQGDRLTVTMSGWTTSPYGENITVLDQTTGNVSNLTLFDPYGNFPLNPAYSTNSYENGLQWTPGGEYPAVFAFETGHGRDPAYPSNTSFNYCDPGRPPATASNPNVPCPSYDPGSWANDSLQPWRIDVPTFFSGTKTERPAQVSFSQDLGGIDLVESSPGCPGNEGSAYCSYPWYSYSCSTHSFQFGATDYLGVTSHFGKYRQYATASEVNNVGNGYYAPTNFTIPACGAPTASVQVHVSGTPGGQVDLLSHVYSGSATLTNLSLGGYSIHGIDGGAARFSGWVVTGNVTIDVATNAWATLLIGGDGSVTAIFATNPPLTNVTFHDSLNTASVAVFPNYLVTGNGAPLATVPNNGSLNLSSQIYSVEALPPPGYNFSYWTVGGPGAVVASEQFPDSWFLVTGAAAAVTVTAWYSASPSPAYVYLSTFGTGTITFNGATLSSWSATTAVGTFPLTANPGPGWQFYGWSGGGSLVLPDLAESTNVTLETGTSYITAEFIQAAVNVTFVTAPGGVGAISLSPPYTVPNGTALPLLPGDWRFVAVPSSGYAFHRWTVNNTSAAEGFSPRSLYGQFLLNASVTVTATFVAAPLVSVGFQISPAAGGDILFNLRTWGNGSTNSTVSNGTYDLEFLPAPGYTLFNSGTSGRIRISGSMLNISDTGGVVFANFTLLPLPTYALTFVSMPSNATRAAVGGTATRQGGTLFLLPGSYTLNGSTGPNDTFTGWASSGGVTVAASNNENTTITVATGGTVYALGVDFRVLTASVAPNPIDVGLSIMMHAVAQGAAGRFFNYTWSNLPPGCAGPSTVPVNTLWCTPSASGSFAIELNVSDANGAVLGVPALPLVIAPSPSVSAFTASRTSFDLGLATLLTVTAGGGAGPFTYSYAGFPNGCAAQNASAISCTPLLVGSSTVRVHVVDTFGESGNGTVSFSVHPDPSLSAFNSTRTVVTLGASTALTVVVGNGTAPFAYAYSGLPAGCTSQNSPQLTCLATKPGAYEIRVNATDADGFTVSKKVFLLVNPLPKIISFAADPASFQLGNGTNITVDVFGGTGPIEYAYSGLPPGCVSSNNTTVACHPTQPGNFSIQVTATDVFGANVTASLYLNALSNATGPLPGGSVGSTAFPGIPALLGALLAAIAVGAILGAVSGRRRPESLSRSASEEADPPSDPTESPPPESG